MNSKRILYGLGSILFVWMVLLNIRPIQDPDLWWHLASGRYMVTHWTLPKTDVFSLTARGSLWVNTYWLQEIPLYLLYRLAGLLGLTLFNSAAIATIVFLIGFFNPERTVSWELRLASAVWIFLAAHPRGYGWGEKASLVTFGFLGLLAYTLRSEQGPASSRWTRAWPFLFMIWANAHRGFLLGLLILGVYLAERCAANPRECPRLLRWGLLCAGATLINPWGWRVYGMGWQDYRLSPVMVKGWAPTPFFHLEIFWLTLILFWCAVGIQSVRHHRPGLGFLAASALLSYFSVRYASFYPYFILWVVPWLVSVMSQKIRRIGNECVLLMSFLGMGLFSYHLYPAFGVNEHLFPAEAVRFLKDSGLRTPFYHDYGFGGYYLWTLEGNPPILIDGRYPAVQGYRPLLPEMDKAMQGAPEDFHRFLQSLNLHCAVVRYPSTEFLHRPFAFYFPRRQWALVYWDDLVLIFAERIPSLQHQIQEYEFPGLEPDADSAFWMKTVWTPASNTKKALIREEAIRNARLHPQSSRARRWLNLLAA